MCDIDMRTVDLFGHIINGSRVVCMGSFVQEPGRDMSFKSFFFFRDVKGFLELDIRREVIFALRRVLIRSLLLDKCLLRVMG